MDDKPMATKLDTDTSPNIDSPISKLSIIRAINQIMIDELQGTNNSTEVYNDAEIKAALFVAADLTRALRKTFDI